LPVSDLPLGLAWIINEETGGEWIFCYEGGDLFLLVLGQKTRVGSFEEIDRVGGENLGGSDEGRER
jgi:hypothetical protein